jgi:hypothetical protein
MSDTAVIVLAWIGVVTLVFALAIRPWGKPERRAPLPLLLLVLGAGWVLVSGAAGYAELIAQGLWTAASVAIPFYPAKAVIYGLFGYVTGRVLAGTLQLHRLRTSVGYSAASPGVIRAVVGGALLAIAGYAVIGDVNTVREAAIDRVARNPHISPEQAARFVAEIESGMLSPALTHTFLGNPVCPPHLLERFAGGAVNDKAAVLSNPNLAPDIVLRLAQDTNVLVRYYAAYHDRMTPDALARLAADPDPEVRMAALRNDKLPDDAFRTLLADPVPRVRRALVYEERLAADDLRVLLNDPDETVRNEARRIADYRGIE